MKMQMPNMRRGWYAGIMTLVLVVAIIVVVILGISVVSALIQKRNLDALVNTNLSAPELASVATQQQQNGDLSGAEQSLEQAMLKQPSSDYESQLAVVKYRLKDYSDSITEYQKLITAGQDEAFAWNGIGNAYRDWALTDTANRTSRETSALNAYTQSVSIDAGYVSAYQNKALLLDDMGQKNPSNSSCRRRIFKNSRKAATGLSFSFGRLDPFSLTLTPVGIYTGERVCAPERT